MKTGGDGKERKEEQHKGIGKVREDMNRGIWWRWEERERSWWMGRERREGEGRIVKRGEEREKD